MKRDYMIGNFDKDIEKTIELVKDKNITEDARIDLVEDFCSEKSIPSLSPLSVHSTIKLSSSFIASILISSIPNTSYYFLFSLSLVSIFILYPISLHLCN